MFVTAWNNGRHHASGAGYGLKVAIADRDRCFDPEEDSVVLELEGWDAPVTVNTAKASFWGPTCWELIDREIGRWLRRHGLAPWPEGRPPRLRMEPLARNRFAVRPMVGDTDSTETSLGDR